MNQFTKFMNKNSSTILTIIGAGGVVLTGALSGKAAIKANRIIETSEKELSTKEKVKETWTCYIPPVLAGTATIACIFGANILNLNHQASIASAYALLDQSYRKYKDKVKDIYGEEAHNQIIDEIAKEECKPPYLSCSGLVGSTSLDFGYDNEPIKTFYDTYSNRYFESTINRVLQAQYHLNRNFMLMGEVPLNMFYEFLGLPEIDGGDDVGWDIYDGDIYWIDFNNRVNEDDIFVIDYVFRPWLTDVRNSKQVTSMLLNDEEL